MMSRMDQDLPGSYSLSSSDAENVVKKERGQYKNTRDVYDEYCQIMTSNENERSKRKKILAHFLVYLLCTMPPDKRFLHRAVFQVIENSVGDDPNFDPEKASNAFVHLEHYLLLIMESPWKVEFQTLKTYNGFFKVKIMAHLSRAMELLKLVGFQQMSEDSLQIVKPVDLETCRRVAFDMLVASVECKLIITTFRRLRSKGYAAIDIIRTRLSSKGDADSLMITVTESCKPTFSKSFRTPVEYEDNLQVHLPADCRKTHQYVNTVPATATGLETRFVHGARLVHQPDLDGGNPVRTDSGYHTVNVPMGSERSRMSRNSSYKLAQHPSDDQLRRDATAATRDPVLQQLREEQQKNDPNNYEEGTMDDHLAAASLITLNMSETPPKNVSRIIPMLPYQQKAGSEWNYVRDGLLQKYGDGYFRGEREDILHAQNRGRVGTSLGNSDKISDEGIEVDSLEPKKTVGGPAPARPPRPGPNSTGLNGSRPVSRTNIGKPLPSFVEQFDSRPVVYPPPLVARGKPFNSSDLHTDCDDCDGQTSSELNPPQPRDRPERPEQLRRQSSSEGLFADGGHLETAAQKSAFFKEKLQDYERIDQQINSPREIPSLQGREPSQGREPLRNSESSWECRSCTFRNSINSSICQVCNKSASEGPLLHPKTYARLCNHCTYENTPDSVVCDMCEKALNKFETVI